MVPNDEYAANCPGMPWKKAAAIGGAMTMSVDKIKPKPPCCMAMELMPSEAVASLRPAVCSACKVAYLAAKAVVTR